MGKIVTIILFIKAIALDEEGATAIEYSILAASIAAVIAGVVGDVGQDVFNAFEAFSNAW